MEHRPRLIPLAARETVIDTYAEPGSVKVERITIRWARVQDPVQFQQLSPEVGRIRRGERLLL